MPLGTVVEGQGQPSHRLGGDPLIQPEPPEKPLRRLAGLRRPCLLPEGTETHRLPQRGVTQRPETLVINVQCLYPFRVIPGKGADAAHDGQPKRIVHVRLALGLPCPQGTDAAAFLVDLPADGAAVGVVPGSGQDDPHRLTPGRAGSAGHDIPKLPLFLSVQLVKNHAAGRVAVLAVSVRAEHPEEAAVRPVEDPPLRLDHF